jgi:hypothetical protein
MVAAVTAAAAVACTPIRGLGSLTYTRGGHRHVVDLGTCRDTVVGGSPRPAPTPAPAFRSPDGKRRVTVRAAGGKQMIWVGGRSVLSLPRWRPFVKNGSPGPLMLFGWSGDSRWIFFAIDPMGSQSIIADGVQLQAVSVDGVVRDIAPALANDDYRTWCGGRLVLTAGGDRIATNNKRLVVTAPPLWKAQRLVRDPRRSFGSVACAPGGRSVVAQSQPTSSDANFFHTHWSLWRVGFDGTQRRLTSPPPGYADESPRFSGTTLFFVRSHRGVGRVYALRNGKLLGPFATLQGLGYYGHHEWPYSVRR